MHTQKGVIRSISSVCCCGLEKVSHPFRGVRTSVRASGPGADGCGGGRGGEGGG